MKIDFLQTIKNLEGNAILHGDKPATLQRLSVDALLIQHAAEGEIADVEKAARYELAHKLYDPVVDLTVEEIAKIKKLVGRAYNTIAVGPAWRMLDGKDPLPSVVPQTTPAPTVPTTPQPVSPQPQVGALTPAPTAPATPSGPAESNAS